MRILVLLLIAMWSAGMATAQEASKLAGDYAGTLGPLHLKLHLKVDAQGHLTGTLDSVDQGANGLPCSNFQFDGSTLSFAVPVVHGNWKGTVKAGSSTLDGTWSQGTPMSLVFRREEPFVPAAKLSAVDGIWLGTLQAGGQSLRIQLHVRSDVAGKEYCTFDSLDQGAAGLDCANVKLSGANFSFEVPSVHGSWTGTLSADHNALNGTWSQGKPLALNFARQEKAIAVKGPAPPSFDPAIAPVSVDQLPAVLGRDFANVLKDGALAPGTGVGAVIGVIQHGTRRILTYGAAKPDSIFEIGSITKTFTGLILAQMVEQGRVKLDEPVRELLPPGTVAKPNGPEITLLDLATQHSGLPRMPDNFHPADPQNPYADYNAADLYAYIAKHGVAKSADAGFLYSNLGFGLLGQALANCAKTSYPELLRTELTEPLRLNDTTVTLSSEQQKRFIEGHLAGPGYRPAHAWDLDALAGAGAIRSTASDLLTYLEANLHPKQALQLAGAIEMSHELRADAMVGMRIALAWLYKPQEGAYWHNGGTGGYSAFALFNPKLDYGIAVLVNMAPSPANSLADTLALHVDARLNGQKAITIR
jgi:serine-type D-Ala-D-Ala carboxypeptidase/endopeptidase